VDALKRYRTIAQAGGWPRVPDQKVLKPGMTDPTVAVLRERLAQEGVPGEAPGSPAMNAQTVYDEALVRAVKAFQLRHGLEADGVIGPKTFISLNTTAQERVDQLRLSLERGRWLMRDLDDEFVLVNIAAPRTYYFKPGGTVWTTRSVAGSAYRQTPVFRDEIQYMEFNPTWTVPASIFLKDKLPRIRKDPGYLERNNYMVVRTSDRTPVNASTVNWGASNPGVTLVQRPGPDNALGLVKFMFPNKYAVYLHDTNQRELFDRTERNLSSGCIRLEHPFEFASLLMEGNPDWSGQRMQTILDSGKTTRINLDRPVPVLLTYWTAWVENGDVQFREDPYGRDEPILAALNR
jgi:murein L,D-transpeptidase YcbB/YkuD